MSDAAPAALEQAIRQFVIYERPADYPDGYVVREWQITPGKAEPGQAWTAATLEAARSLLPTGVTLIAGRGQNEPPIVEVWI